MLFRSSDKPDLLVVLILSFVDILYFLYYSDCAVGASNMNFSEVFKQSNQLCRVSPDGNYLVSHKMSQK